jgi:hypothetical protein
MSFSRFAKPISLSIDLLTMLVRPTACLLAIVTLLSFPALRSHSYQTHLRSPVVRRLVVRHTAISPAPVIAKLQLAQHKRTPVLTVRVEPQALDQNREVEVPARASIVQVLHRIKLGSRGDRDSEPNL